MNFLRRAFILATPERPLAIAEQLHDARWRHSNFGDLFHKDIRVKTIRAFRAAHFQVAVKTELFLVPLVSAGSVHIWFNTCLIRVDVKKGWTAITVRGLGKRLMAWLALQKVSTGPVVLVLGK